MLADPTRAAALARLTEFAPRMGRDYAALRNTDGGPEGRCVSALSAHVRHRLVSESELVGAALAQHGPMRAEKFIQEVFWRSYWKGFLELRPGLWRDYRAAVARMEGPPGLAAAMAGETGWLHNHTRMWFASIWIFTLRLPWELGAEFFLAHLADADPASNTLSWRWVAGIQTPGKHYLARAENIARYTNGRFNPRGQLDEAALPIEAQPPPPAGRLRAADTQPGGRVALLLHMDDLGFRPEGCEVVGVAALAEAAPQGRFPRGRVAAGFTAAALADAGRPLLAAGEVADWARGLGVTRIVTPWAPIGWTAPLLEDVAARCAAEGIALHRLRRAWDEACWPLAQRGFFPFRAEIPRLIAELRPTPP